MNEAETRAELIDPKLKAVGWGEIEGSKILREYRFTDGRILGISSRAKPEIADYVLIYKNQKIAVIEAKAKGESPTEGVNQAKIYARKLDIPYTYSTNGEEIFEISMLTGKEQYLGRFPTPEELWNAISGNHNDWKEKFAEVPFESVNGSKDARYYQEIAINKALEAVAEDKNRILLTLATGTGKTFIAFQITWKLFHARWNIQKDGKRRPRVLFLADRNILADQAFNAFSAFQEDALIRISPTDIKKTGTVPTNGSIFFTIFQTFMSGQNNTPYFGEYPSDFFDLIIIDECHRGGANDEGNWRSIMEHFDQAVQIGLTATPKRKDNVDTYRYFGEPVYTYSLKDGVNDGFLTPFKIQRVQTTLDEYVYTHDDQVVEGEVEEGKVYTETDFNRIIEIKEREKNRVQILLNLINQDEKSIIFCASQDHALAVRDLVNQLKESPNPEYCVRVTAHDGKFGDQYLKEFQDNEKTIPTILTTSQKLSTGVDARNVRNVVIMRPINSMIEFKQIIGRGTRLYDGKAYFTIYDFVGAYKLFLDPEWDGEPADETSDPVVASGKETEFTGVAEGTNSPYDPVVRVKIKLRDGKEREIQHMISTSYFGADGKAISSDEFIQKIAEVLPSIFTSEQEVTSLWSDPRFRANLLKDLEHKGFGLEQLKEIMTFTNSTESDIFDVLNYIAFAKTPITRLQRVASKQNTMLDGLNNSQKEFIDFVLTQYVERGSIEISEDNLPALLKLKYGEVIDATEILGDEASIRSMYFEMQNKLYSQ